MCFEDIDRYLLPAQQTSLAEGRNLPLTRDEIFFCQCRMNQSTLLISLNFLRPV